MLMDKSCHLCIQVLSGHINRPSNPPSAIAKLIVKIESVGEETLKWSDAISVLECHLTTRDMIPSQPQANSNPELTGNVKLVPTMMQDQQDIHHGNQNIVLLDNVTHLDQGMSSYYPEYQNNNNNNSHQFLASPVDGADPTDSFILPDCGGQDAYGDYYMGQPQMGDIKYPPTPVTSGGDFFQVGTKAHHYPLAFFGKNLHWEGHNLFVCSYGFDRILLVGWDPLAKGNDWRPQEKTCQNL